MEGITSYLIQTVTIDRIEGEHEFACVQLHNTMMGRDMVKETTLSDYIKDPSSGNDRVTYPTFKGDIWELLQTRKSLLRL